jgi:cytosine/adenosine deaminase-related metal-dependent hydrolase
MIIVRAKYLITNPENCIEDGAVAVEGTKIHCVGTFERVKILIKSGEVEVIDLGNAVLLPGLINMHTHLDLTHLQNRIKPTKNFTHWVFQLVGARIRWKADDYISSLEKGIQFCIEAGTTTVADVAHTEHSFSILKKSPLRKIVYQEVIDLNPRHADDVVREIEIRLSTIKKDDLMNIGLSPHAPYSVSKELYQAIAQFAHHAGIPLCTHIAETQDEIEFLTRGTGNFAIMLRQLRAAIDDWQAPGLTPIYYLNGTGILNNNLLLIHCNYVSDEEVSMIKSSGSTVVFCPRSHRFFGHAGYPIQKLLNAGINVGLGTDSLASNDTLSILDEMKFLFYHYSLLPKTIFSMATVNGAKALGLKLRIGQIKENFEADICGISLPDHHHEDIYRKIIDVSSRNIFTMIAGVVCYHSTA